MNELSGELVELDFYFQDLDRAKAMAQMVRHCCRHGGTFAGTVLLCEGPDAKKHRYSSIADRSVRRLNINADELEKNLGSTDVDVISTAIWSAIGITNDVPEIVTYCGVSYDSFEVDNPSIAILSEGWVFSTPGFEKQAKKAGRRCYDKFVEVCNALDPDYAAILNEDSLPCRSDLRLGVGKRCFTDFFVSNRACGLAIIKEIEVLFQDAYIERLSTGIYVSTCGIYNRLGVTIDQGVSLERSAKVAHMLGRKRSPGAPGGLPTVKR